MARLSVADLPPSRKPYRVDLHSPNFETIEFSEAEDTRRAKSLRASCVLPNELFDAEEASVLATRLDYVGRGKAYPKSLACSAFMRRLRQRVFGHLWKTVVETGVQSVSRFDLIGRGWDFTSETLEAADPNKLLAALRTDLNRCGAASADGFLFAALHGEFEPEASVYQLHVHGIATDGMIDVVDALRTRPKYKSGDGVRHRVVISRNVILNLAYRITYVLKSYWPCRRIGLVGNSAKPKRSRGGSRIREPYHSQCLLWLDRWRPSDITLLVHLSVDKGGFRSSNRRKP